jgi:hypothetical protein
MDYQPAKDARNRGTKQEMALLASVTIISGKFLGSSHKDGPDFFNNFIPPTDEITLFFLRPIAVG